MEHRYGNNYRKFTTHKLTHQRHGVITPDGVYPIEQILKYKKSFQHTPECILKNYSNNFIMNTPTNVAVTNRQRHPVLKKMCDINEINSKIIFALNKLTLSNTSEIANIIKKIDNINTFDGLDVLISHIMKNVSIEKNFTQAYAAVCSELSCITIEMDNKIVCFGELIASKYKNLFSECISNITDSKVIQTTINILIVDNTNDHNLDKSKILNHIRFMGYTYIMELITIDTIEYCIDTIISNITAKFCVEMVIELLRIIFEKYKIENKSKVEKYIEQLQITIDKCSTFRDKFLIQDFIEKHKVD